MVGCSPVQENFRTEGSDTIYFVRINRCSADSTAEAVEKIARITEQKANSGILNGLPVGVRLKKLLRRMQ